MKSEDLSTLLEYFTNEFREEVHSCFQNENVASPTPARMTLGFGCSLEGQNLQTKLKNQTKYSFVNSLIKQTVSLN